MRQSIWFIHSCRQGQFQHLTALYIMIAYSIEIRKDHMFAQFLASLQQRSMSVSASVEFEVLSLFDEENESKLQYMTIATIESRGTYM